MLIQTHSTEMQFARFPHEMPVRSRSAYGKASVVRPSAIIGTRQQQRTKCFRFRMTILIGSSACRLQIQMQLQLQRQRARLKGGRYKFRCEGEGRFAIFEC